MNNERLSQSDIVNIINILEEKNDIYLLVNKSFRYIAEKINIAAVELECTVNGEVNIVPILNFINEEEKHNYCLYTKEYNTEKIITNINIYKNNTEKEWFEQEIQSLDILIKLIYMHLEKDKLLSFIEKAKNTDQQTGVANYNGVYNYLFKVFEEDKKADYAAAYFNLKDFKVINSQLGRDKATEILLKYTVKIAEEVSEYGIVGRLGGDNFMAIIKKDHLEEFINKLKSTKLVTNDEKEQYKEIELQARAGIYLLTGFEVAAGQVIGKMTTTFSMCRKNDKNDILFYDEKLENLIIMEKELESNIEPAIKNEEFFVVYQPKVDLETYEVVGAEALIRWNHNGTILPPYQFIPLCERNGLICKLDLYVLETVCKAIRRWIDEGIKPVKVSVNFSKKHFSKDDTADIIMKIIKKYDISPELLEIEFTETAYLDEYENLVNTLKDLKSYGLSTSMDDFGVGYSSINLLQDLQIDVLKLDRVFLIKQANERNKIICENIVKMSKELQMDIISEGVETEEHVSFLKSIGCNKAQGYLFDKPLEEKEFVKRLISGKY